MLSALHRIETYPVDLAAPIFVHYPAMKFGHLTSASHFAERLAPLALEMIKETAPTEAGWILTSPPLQGLPCGANLVCQALSGLLEEALPGGAAPRLETIRVGGRRLPIASRAEFAGYHEYSKLDAQARQQFHQAYQGRVTYDLAAFAGRHVLFVNDINVTGTQLGRIDTLLHNAGAKSLGVVLILQVERAIGLAAPQLENEINTSRLAGFGDFTAFLRDADYQPTGKLISRLLSHEACELDALFQALALAKRRRLYQAILQEEIYGGSLFGEKMAILRRGAFRAGIDDIEQAGG